MYVGLGVFVVCEVGVCLGCERVSGVCFSLKYYVCDLFCYMLLGVILM